MPWACARRRINTRCRCGRYAFALFTKILTRFMAFHDLDSDLEGLAPRNSFPSLFQNTIFHGEQAVKRSSLS